MAWEGKPMKHLLLAILALALTACASGSSVVTGVTRAPLTADQVRIYSEAPAHYEVIGIVSATSITGWTQQQDTDQAIAELKRRAAALGANGILLEHVGRADSVVGSGAGGVFTAATTSSSAGVQGRAIYVPPNQ